MASYELILLIQILALILYITAFYFSYKIYKLGNYPASWLFINLAILISLSRRILGVYVIVYSDIILPQTLDLLDRPIIPFLTGLFFLLGFLGMLKEMKNR